MLPPVANFFEINHLWASCSLPRKELELCDCGNNIRVHEWFWVCDMHNVGYPGRQKFSEDHLGIIFNPTYSTGTTVILGNKPFKQDMHYYWEVKISTTLYGTDVMVGVGKPLNSEKLGFLCNKFCSALGIDEQSWGFSYLGHIHHESMKRKYGRKFGLGDYIGCYLDTFHGTIEFYIDRIPQGIAFRGLNGKIPLYPMSCSTSAQTGLNLICSVSQPTTLQLLCLKKIVQDTKLYDDYVESYPSLYRYYSYKYFWIVPNQVRTKRKLTEDDLYNYSLKKMIQNKKSPRRKKTQAFNESDSSGSSGTGVELSDDDCCLNEQCRDESEISLSERLRLNGLEIKQGGNEVIKRDVKPLDNSSDNESDY